MAAASYSFQETAVGRGFNSLRARYRSMHYHIILTKECNLNCSYCGGGSDSPPKELQYQISDLKSFLSHDINPVLEFYGGEPLLRIDAMKKVMDEVPGRFVIQTNGVFLDKMEPEYLKKFHSILVSIDGTKGVTDKNRSNGLDARIQARLDTPLNAAQICCRAAR